MKRSDGQRSARLILLLSLLCLALVPILTGCDRKEDPEPAVEVVPSDSLTVVLDGADSVSVFTLLTARHAVDYDQSAMGVFVKGIDSVVNGDGYYWMYSVNDSMGQVAADARMTKTGDVVRWHFRKAGQ
jgi:hypothetical protein